MALKQETLQLREDQGQRISLGQGEERGGHLTFKLEVLVFLLLLASSVSDTMTYEGPLSSDKKQARSWVIGLEGLNPVLRRYSEGRSLPLPGTQMVSKGPTLLSLQRGTVQREGDTPQPDPGPDDFRRVTDLALVNIQFSLGPSGYQRENLLGFFPFNKKQNHPSNIGHIHNCITLFFHCIYIFIIVIFMVYL